jgi:transposase
MAAAIALRDDFDGPALRQLAKGTKDAAQARRLLALAEIRDGGARSDAARVGGVGLQTIRDWVLRFNARGPAGLIDGKAPGNASKLNDAQRKTLAGIVERGPIPAIHEVVRWRLADLAQWIWEGEPLSAIGPRTMASGISLSETTVGRELRALGYRKISARPRHYAQNELAIDDFKKDFRPSWTRSAKASRLTPR